MPRSSRNLGAITPDDFVRLQGLRRMQWIALGLLLLMAVIFVISFALQDRYPWLSYVRAASEGGMVGAIADWFAVTAIFRHPLGLKIPHTNLVASKKNDIGDGLGSFIEENFLADEVVHNKLSQISGARAAGVWIQADDHADRLAAVLSDFALGTVTVLDDSDVQELFEGLARKHLVEPEWSPLLSKALDSFVRGGHHESLIDMAADRGQEWLQANPGAFDRLLSSRLPTWIPSIAQRFVDDRMHAEAMKFLQNVRNDQDHPFRLAASGFLRDFAADLSVREDLKLQVESYKHEVFDSPRIRELAASTWSAMQAVITELLTDPNSELRTRMSHAIADFGLRLTADRTLQFKIDVWVMQVVEHLVRSYRHDIANVVTETVRRWDAKEAAEKIELQIGKDLQFIRINGTVIGSLAGLVIFGFATLVISPLTS